MEDNRRNHAQPVATPSEVWHLARGQAYEQAAVIVAEALAEVVDETAAALLQDVSRQFQQGAADAWAQYLSAGARLGSQADRDEVIIEFDEEREMPVLQWVSKPPSSSWALMDLPDGDDPFAGASMVLAVPFRMLDLGRLPEEHVLVKLQDPHHAATAALVEVLSCVQRDSIGAFMGRDTAQGWRRLNGIISIYRQSATVSLQALDEDDYVGWRPGIPDGFHMGAAAALICRHASTARAQCALAIHLVAAWLQALADHHSSVAGEPGKEAFLRRLKEAGNGLEQTLSGMNDALARDNWAEPVPFSTMVVFRTEQSTIPMLIIVPAKRKAAVTKLFGSAQPVVTTKA